MYTNEEISKIRKKFWASFGQYMKPVPGAGYDAVNWLNYKTGIRNIFFRMDAGNQKASIGIEIRHATNAERQHYYNQFVALKKILEQSSVYEWHWQADAEDDNGQVISRISQSLYNVTILKEADWPAIIAFLKPRMVSLDGFWEMVKDGFE